jgi:hypothetical protein
MNNTEILKDLNRLDEINKEQEKRLSKLIDFLCDKKKKVLKEREENKQVRKIILSKIKGEIYGRRK